MSRAWACGIVLAWLGSTAAAAAAAEEPVRLTLAGALRQAEQHNAELGAALARVDVHGARADAAGRAHWPRLSLAADAARTDTPARVFAGRLDRGAFTAADFQPARLNAPDPATHLTTVASLQLPIDVFGRTSAHSRETRALAHGEQAAWREAQQDLRLRVTEAYHQAALEAAALRVARRAAEGARARERDIAERQIHGAALTADVLRARARRRQREAEVAEHEAYLETAIASLGTLIGAPDGRRFETVDVAAARRETVPLEEWQRRAEARGVLETARQQATAAGWSARGESLAALPVLGVYGQLQDDRGASANARSYAVGLSVRWNVFDPAHGKRTAAARAAQQAAAETLRAASDRVRLEVATAFWRVAGARARLEAARGGAAEGYEALRIVQERRRVGMATLTDELETEAAALSAELEELAGAAAVAVAEASLDRAAGRLEIDEREQ